jgi:hypothetical protein
MKIKVKSAGIVFLALFLIQSIFSFSQSYQDSLKKDDDDIISSIAPYPEDVRNAILNVSQYSQKLVKIERIQARTSQSFQDLLSSYPREEQEKYYELSRYPELIHQLVDGPPQTLEQVKPTLTKYPQEVSAAVTALFPMHLADLTAMDKTYQSSQKALDDIIKDLPDAAQADFRKVIGMPEVMSLLTERIDLAVSLGDAYKNDPQGTKRKIDSLSNQINAQNQKDLEDYKKQVASDPKMQEEMKKSAQDFADSYSANGEAQGPSDAVLDQNQQQVSQPQDQQPQVVNNYYGYGGGNYNPNPYPYWFGYPSWYSYPMWYPQPLYYHTGFYIGVGGAIVVLGLPSRAYSGWFFNYGYHRYPRYYNYCNTYYHAHAAFVNRVNGNVYRGFNSNVNRHFAQVNRNNINRGNVDRHVNVNGNVSRENMNRTQNTNRSAPANNNFRNSINANNVNHQAYSNFHATEYHQQSWGSVGGGGAAVRTGGGGGGFHPSGGGGGGGRGRR